MMKPNGNFFRSLSRLTNEQKKIIALGAIIFGALAVFWLLVYIPQNKNLLSIKNELRNTEYQVAQILNMVSGKELSLAVKEMKLSLQDASQKLLHGDEAVISYISQAARKLKIEVKSIIPGQGQLAVNRVGGYTVEELPLSLDLICGYRVLGEYLQGLRSDFPVLVKVRQIDISGSGEGVENLRVNLRISAYLAGDRS